MWSAQSGRSRPPGTVYLYVIGSPTGPQKIGISRDPHARCAQLQTGNHDRLRVAVAIEISARLAFDAEVYAHRSLRPHRLRGEWFNVTPEIAVAAVRTAAQIYGGGAVMASFAPIGRYLIRREAWRLMRRARVPWWVRMLVGVVR